MAKVTRAELVGSLLHIYFDDGSYQLASPSSVYRWTGIGVGGGPEPSSEFMWPITGAPGQYITSEYGPRSGGAGTFHEGIDIAPAEGTDMYCAGNGTVDTNGWHSNFGNLIIIDHGVLADGQRYKTLYAHRLNPTSHTVGQTVAKGAIIGQVGNTGASFGAHLHWETHKMAPNGNIVWNTNDDGGFRTAINPRDFMAVFGA